MPKMQQRRGTALQWTTAGTVLLAGEIGFETDTGKFKIGDGTTAWASLTYQSDASLLTGNATGLTSVTTTGNVVVGGNLTVNGTTTTINSTTLSVDDKNIELGSVASPTDVTADGAGITVKGTTDKTFNWVDATDAWTSSEDFNLLTGKVYKINATTVLSNTEVLGKEVTSANTASTIVARDASENFAANTITANVIGKVTVDSAGTSSVGEIFVTQPVQINTSATGTVGTVTNTAGIFSANVTVVSGSLTNVTANMISTATAGAGNFGANPLKVVSITNATSVVMSSATTFTAGAVTTIRFFSVPSATPVTGDLWFW